MNKNMRVLYLVFIIGGLSVIGVSLLSKLIIKNPKAMSKPEMIIATSSSDVESDDMYSEEMDMMVESAPMSKGSNVILGVFNYIKEILGSISSIMGFILFMIERKKRKATE